MNTPTFIILLSLFSLTARAELPSGCTEQLSAVEITGEMVISTDVPKHLKGAVIIVRQADGRESVVPAEKYKVVPRKQQYLTTHTKDWRIRTCITNEPRKNRASLLGGHGAQGGLKSGVSGSAAEVESNVGLVGGAQYQRMLDDRWSVGVQGQTNKTGSVLLGIDF